MDRTESSLAELSSHPEEICEESVDGDLRQRAESLVEERRVDDPIGDPEMSRAELARELQVLRIENKLQREQIDRFRHRLEETRESYRDLYFHAPVGYVTLDGDGAIRELNYLAAELLGGTRDSLLGDSLQNCLADEAHSELDRHLQKLRRESGVQSCELSIQLPTGGLVRLKMLSITVDTDGDSLQFRSALFDITEQRRAEEDKQQLEQRLEISQRMETIGRLASGIAHDFNNLLTLIIGYSKLAINHLDDDHPLHKHVCEINKAGRHAGELIEQLLAFSRSDGTSAGVIDANELIEGMETMFDRLIGDDIELHTQLHRQLGTIHFDGSQFKQVMMNLVVNARDAMEDGGNLAIRTRNLELTPQAASRLDLQAGPCVVIEVEDDGDGIPPEIVPHIFEPFFTTKSTDDNHGFGLSTTYGFVNRHGGAIDVVTEPDGGTMFSIFLPRVDEPAADESGGDPAVLVVDDQPELESYATLVLDEMELDIFSTSCPAEAVELSRNMGPSLELVVTDVTMPKLKGPALLERIRRIHPDVDVLYISGHDEASLHSDYDVDPGAPLLEKPFTPDRLRSKVQELLGDETSRK